MGERKRWMVAMSLVALMACAVFTDGFTTPAAKAGADTKKEQRQLRHVVLFKFKESASAKQVKAIEDAFRALPTKIDTISGFEWGTDVSVEDLADGFTHCFFVTFKTQEGLKAYLPHEAHQDFVALLKPHLDKVLVFDYWARK
jgi:hypothetical protein